MEILVILSFYMLGIITGAIGIVTMTLAHANKTAKNKLKALSTDKPTVDQRMKKVKELVAEQLELSRRADGPQKNGLDGKYKNQLIRQLKALEEEKNDILRSIILDGEDPTLTTMDESGTVTQMKLSEYMAYMGVTMAPKKETVAPKQEPKTERIGKFTVVKGGKDDGGNTTH